MPRIPPGLLEDGENYVVVRDGAEVGYIYHRRAHSRRAGPHRREPRQFWRWERWARDDDGKRRIVAHGASRTLHDAADRVASPNAPQPPHPTTA